MTANMQVASDRASEEIPRKKSTLARQGRMKPDFFHMQSYKKHKVNTAE